MNLKCIIYSMNELATEKVPACTQHIITFPLSDSQHASADPSPSPRTHSSGASDADVNGTSGLKPTAGKAANFMCWNRWLACVSHSYHEVNVFYAAHCSSFSLRRKQWRGSSWKNLLRSIGGARPRHSWDFCLQVQRRCDSGVFIFDGAGQVRWQYLCQ